MRIHALGSQTGSLFDPVNADYTDSVAGSTRTVSINVNDETYIKGTWKLIFTW